MALLESLLHQQRQAAGSYQTREIQGALQSCQSLMADVNRHSTASIRECVQDCSGDHCSCAPQSSNTTKPDNRSLVMTYAQSARDSRTSQRDLEKAVTQYKKPNGNALTVPNSTGIYKNSKENDRMGLLQYQMSPMKRKSASEA